MSDMGIVAEVFNSVTELLIFSQYFFYDGRMEDIGTILTVIVVVVIVYINYKGSWFYKDKNKIESNLNKTEDQEYPNLIEARKLELQKSKEALKRKDREDELKYIDNFRRNDIDIANLNFEIILEAVKTKKLVCPIPEAWANMVNFIFDGLSPNDFQEIRPFVFAGWSDSSDEEKRERFLEQLEYFKKNNLTKKFDKFVKVYPVKVKDNEPLTPLSRGTAPYWYFGGESFYTSTDMAEDYRRGEVVIKKGVEALRDILEKHKIIDVDDPNAELVLASKILDVKEIEENYNTLKTTSARAKMEFLSMERHLELALEDRKNLTGKELFYVAFYKLFLNYCSESLNNSTTLHEFCSDIIYGLDENEIPTIT